MTINPTGIDSMEILRPTISRSSYEETAMNKWKKEGSNSTVIIQGGTETILTGFNATILLHDYPSNKLIWKAECYTSIDQYTNEKSLATSFAKEIIKMLEKDGLVSFPIKKRIYEEETQELYK